MLRLIFVVVACQFIFNSCQKEPEPLGQYDKAHTLKIIFTANVAGDSLVPGNEYSNEFSEKFTVSDFRFYVHGIRLYTSATGAGSPQKEDDQHHLVDLSRRGAHEITMKVAEGNFDQLKLIIGVDSIYNVSGAQDGALDPSHGMFWTWNTGYIMARLEGTSPSANTPGNVFEYHIGGFSGPYNTIRNITLDLPATLVALKDEGTSIHIGTDLYKWFGTIHNLFIASNPVCTTPGELASQYADNYARMFEIKSVNRLP